MDRDVVQRFLESVGQKGDVDLYLKMFRAQERESFAIIAADADMVRAALDPFHFDLRILAGSGLYPVVLLGLFDAKDADRQAQRVHDWLVEDAVPARIVSRPTTLHGELAHRPGAPAALAGPDAEAVRQVIATGTIPIVSLEAAKEASTDERFDLLTALATRLGTRKVIFLSPTLGLEREGTAHISDVNLSADYERLTSTKGRLARRHYTLLRQVNQLLHEVPHRMSVAVVSPLLLLRELFTISGAGTMIRKGSRIETHTSLERIDRARLEALLESAFGKLLRKEALEQGIEHIFLEEGYLGAALLSQTPIGAYLSKFAVERTAQGEGIGGDLWQAILRHYPSLFWRSRPDNPINPWYAKQCDGLQRLPEWHVYWKGLPVERVADAIAFARARPADFLPRTAG